MPFVGVGCRWRDGLGGEVLGQNGCVGGGKHLSFHDLAGSAAIAAALGWHPQGSHNHHECSSSQPLVTCQLLHLSDPSSRPQCPLEWNASGIVGRFHVVAEGPARYLPSAMSDSLAISGNLWIIYRTTRLESGLDGAQVSSGVFVMGLAHEGSRAMGPTPKATGLPTETVFRTTLEEIYSTAMVSTSPPTWRKG